MKPLIYIAGPYTEPDPVLNVRRACEAADRVLAAGGLPYVPHLSHLWHLIKPKSYEEWVAIDLAMLAHCDGFWRLSGASPGAEREEREAQKLGLGILLRDDGLATWICLLKDRVQA